MFFCLQLNSLSFVVLSIHWFSTLFDDAFSIAILLQSIWNVYFDSIDLHKIEAEYCELGVHYPGHNSLHIDRNTGGIADIVISIKFSTNF